MARYQITSWAFVAVVLNLVFWIIAMGGVSAVTYECHKKTSAANCARGLQFEWYSCILEVFLLLFLMAIGYSTNYQRYKVVAIAFLVLVTGQLTWAARSFMVAEDDAVGQKEDGEEARWSRATMSAAAAGYVLLCLTNYVLIWMYGTADPTPSATQFQKEAMMTSSGGVQV